MIPGWILLLASLAYLALLLAVAHVGERRPLHRQHDWLGPIVCSLALAVYCAAWIFYAAVGSAVGTGWSLLPILLGPLLLLLFLPAILRRLLRSTREVEKQHAAELRSALEAQRAARQEAEAANLSKARFLAAAGHDLLQPLNAARQFASALANGPTDPDEVQPLAQEIDGALRAAEELLDGLLDVARLDSGALKPGRTAIDACQLLAALREQFAPLAESRGLQLRLHCPRGAWVLSDPALLRRVLQNFVANALRYTALGGVLLAARRRGDAIEFSVWDTGPGIAAEHAAIVFEEFRRLDAPSPWGEKGLGLGLSICQRIAGLLGHALALHSIPGRGTVFLLRVPATNAAPLAESDAAPTGDVARLDVLCVDDEPAILDVMRELLSRCEVTVRTASSMESAIAAVRERAPDLLLVDNELGEALDGLDVLQILRRDLGPHTSGALISADHSEELARRARALGYPLLPKPVKPAALRALIAALARRRLVN